MKLSSRIFFAVFGIATIATFAGCNDTIYEIRTAPSSIGGSVSSPVSTEDAGSNDAAVSPAPIVPNDATQLDPTPETPKVEAKKEIVLPVNSPSSDDEEPKVNAVKESRADANPPPPPPPPPQDSEKTFGFSDSAAYAPYSVLPVNKTDLCGNGRLDPGEECDDGDRNRVGWDGCTFCTVDAGWTCDNGEPSICAPSS